MKGLVCVCITAAAGLAASASSATPSHYVRVFTNDQFGSCDSGQLAGASASCSSAITVTALGISQQASGTVGLGRGVLDVGASGTGSNLFGASAMAVGADEMFDTLTFHGPGGQVTVTMSAKVALSAPFSGGPPGHFFGQADAYIGLEGLDTSGHEIADAADCSPGANSRFCTPFHEGNAVNSSPSTDPSPTLKVSVIE